TRGRGLLGTGNLTDECIGAIGFSAVVDEQPLEGLLVSTANRCFTSAKPRQLVGEADRRTEIGVLLRYCLHTRVRTVGAHELNAGKRSRIAGRCRQQRILLHSCLAILRQKVRGEGISSVTGQVEVAGAHPVRKRILVELVESRLRRSCRPECAVTTADN